MQEITNRFCSSSVSELKKITVVTIDAFQVGLKKKMPTIFITLLKSPHEYDKQIEPFWSGSGMFVEFSDIKCSGQIKLGIKSALSQGNCITWWSTEIV